MKNKFYLSLIFICLFSFPCLASDRAQFILKEDIIRTKDVHAGMIGQAFTVLKGEKVISFKVKIIDVLDRKSKPRNLILFKIIDKDILENGGVAAGMSGSPIYVHGKLIGAIGYSWSFSDRSLGLATPIEDMLNATKWKDKIPVLHSLNDNDRDRSSNDYLNKEKCVYQRNYIIPLSMPLMTDGISSKMQTYLAKELNTNILPLAGNSVDMNNFVDLDYIPKPGSAIGVALVWGDINVGGIGTLTAVDKNNKFIAFAHPMMNRGSIATPVTTAKILEIIPSLDHSFKLGTMGKIIGLVTQDREEAIAGQFGRLAPAISFQVMVNNLDSNVKTVKNFQTIVDPFMTSKLSTSGIVGIIENCWGRKGEGTVTLTYEINGGQLLTPWKKKNIIFSRTDLAEGILKEIETLTEVFSLNQFHDINPMGIKVTANITSITNVMKIEEISVPTAEGGYKAGEDINITVTLRKWRAEKQVRKICLKIPSDANGLCKINVRAGNNSNVNIENNLKPKFIEITSFEDFLKQLSSVESNNMLLAEIEYNSNKKSSNTEPADIIDKKFEYQKIKEKIEKGVFKILEEESLITGNMTTYIKVIKNNDSQKTIKN
ncbi:MAG: SpoIVB peptidase S55 domain-containing protein [Synergistaceae bacterium]